jgi:diguanylate cyclase (GGDEF)-like protein
MRGSSFLRRRMPNLTDWLRRQPAQRRMRWGFGLLIGLLVAVSALAALRFAQYRASVDEFANQSMQRVRLASELSADTGLLSRQLLTLVTAEREQRVEAYRVIDAAHQRIDLNASALIVLQGGQARRLGPLGTAMATYLGAYADTVELIEMGDLAAVRKLMSLRTEQALAQLANAANERLVEEQARALELARAQGVQLRRDLVLLSVACAVAVLIGSLMARALRRSITQPLQRTEAVARRLATGDYRARAKVRGSDEVAGVAQALNALAEAVAQREAELRRLANTDALTGLAQRDHFLMESALRLFDKSELPHLMVCLDVERLKTINALAGFDAGDAALRRCAERLRAAVDQGLPVGRVGGGNFALLLAAEAGDDATAMHQAQRLRVELEAPFDWQGQSLDLSLTAGLAMFPAHAGDAESLLRRAEQALFEAKRRKLGALLFNPAAEQARLQDLSLASALQEAIERDQLEAHWQPKLRVSMLGVECVGAEALIRWRHPERGLVPPGEFIPFAERTGRIRRLTQWMLAHAVDCLGDPAFEGLQLSVNLSAQDLQGTRPEQYLRNLLAARAVDPSRLTLELTESGLLEPGDDPVALLHGFKQLGVRLAIDDFGTGHSSLAYLQRLPVDELKIDRSFVRDVDQSQRRYELLATIVQLGRTLGMTVTAEGVEREAELQLVRRSGCELVQGFFTGRPMSRAAFAAWRANPGKAG